MDCQFHNNCGGLCETKEEREMCLCSDCLDAYYEREEEEAQHKKLLAAMQRIAKAAGMQLADPDEVANVVCAKLTHQ